MKRTCLDCPFVYYHSDDPRCYTCRNKVVIVDECHTLNGVISDVRTERFAKYIKENPEVKLDFYPFHYLHDEVPSSGPLIRADAPIMRNWLATAEDDLTAKQPNWSDTFYAERAKRCAEVRKARKALIKPKDKK